MTQLLEEHPHGIEKLFESIEKNRPCVVIFDEAEEIFKKREQASNYQKHIITEFLERTGSKNSLKGVCFIAITNYPNLIDEAIKRPGRLGKKYTLKNPLFEDRIEIIKLYLEKLEIEIDKSSLSLKTCAERTDGMLPAEIEALLENAKELMLEKNEDKMNQDIFAEAYQQALLGKKTAIRLDEKEITQTAYHEAAHGLVTFLLEKEGQSLHFFDFLTIEPRAHALGISFSRAKAEYKSMTKEMMLGLISVFLAGKAAQEIIFNQTDAGAGDDLQKATQIAQSFIKTYGMSNTLYTNPDSTNSEKEKDEIEKILQEQYKKVKEFLKKNKKLLDKIVKKVIEKKIIYERDLELIIKEYEEEIKQKVKFKAN
jgi:ATP-dependent Zn protease